MPSNTLPAEIAIVVETDHMGALIMYPKDPTIATLVAQSNQYDHTSDVYIQSPFDAYNGIDFSMLPEDVLWGPDEINDGAIVMMDSWLFRQLVGGQSD